jgi:hypothetical protein
MSVRETVCQWGWTWLLVPYHPLPDGYSLAS